MTVSTVIARFFHSGLGRFAAEKSLLATLRKKTGYTFANCKKALELHNNNLNEAEKWLNDQAQSMGWSKATKLEGRKTTQGLVAVAAEKNYGALVEVNCETDFVAKNNHFKDLTELATKSCLHLAEHSHTNGKQLMKMELDTERLRSLKTSDGKTLADHLALMIGSVGENAALRRAMCFKGNTGVSVTGYVHPSQIENAKITYGKFGALLAFRTKQTGEPKPEILNAARQVCQHIVGMNPRKIGNPLVDKPAANADDEQCLVFQEYLLDPDISVGEFLEENGLDIVDFKRFECGETDDVVLEHSTAVQPDMLQ